MCSGVACGTLTLSRLILPPVSERGRQTRPFFESRLLDHSLMQREAEQHM